MAELLLAFALTVNACLAQAPTPPGYERAVRMVPACHWALVRRAVIDRTSGGQARRADLSIHLTPHRRDGQLWHEVGHIVAYAHPEIERDWKRRFWPDGRPVGRTVSDYARTNEREDFAESYRAYIEGGEGPPAERAAFLRLRVFGPVAR